MVQARPSVVHRRCAEVSGLSKGVLEEVHRRWIRFGHGVYITKDQFRVVYGVPLFGEHQAAKAEELFEFFASPPQSANHCIAGLAGYVDNQVVLGGLVMASCLSRGERFEFIRDNLLLAKKSRAVDLASIRHGTALVYDESLNQLKTEQEVLRLQDKTDKDILDWLCEYDGCDSGLTMRIADVRNLPYRQAILRLTVHERFLSKDDVEFSKTLDVPSSCKLVNIEMVLDEAEKAPISFIEVDLVQLQASAKDPTCIEEWFKFPSDRGEVLVEIKPKTTPVDEKLEKKLKEAKSRLKAETHESLFGLRNSQILQQQPERILGYDYRVVAKFRGNDQVVFAADRYIVCQTSEEQVFSSCASSTIQDFAVHAGGKLIASIEKDSNVVRVFDGDLGSTEIHFRASAIKKPSYIDFSDMRGEELVVVDNKANLLAVYSWKDGGRLIFAENLGFASTCVAFTNEVVLVFGSKVLGFTYSSQSKMGGAKLASGRIVKCLELFSREEPDSHVCCAKLKLNSTIAVSGTEKGSLYTWNGKESVQVTHRAHMGPVLAVAQVSQRVLASGDSLGFVKLWDARSLTVLAELRPFHESTIIRGLSASPTGSLLLVTTMDGPLAALEVEGHSLKPSTVLQAVAQVRCVASALNRSTAIAATSNGYTILWCINSHRILKRAQMNDQISALAWCPASSTVAVALINGTIAFLDSNTLLQKDSTTSTANELLAFSSDGKLLACAKSRQVQVFSGSRLVKSIRLKKRLRPSDNQRERGTILAFTNSNRELRYCNLSWETRTWRPVASRNTEEDILENDVGKVDRLVKLNNCVALYKDGFAPNLSSSKEIVAEAREERNLLYPVTGNQWFTSQPRWIFGMSKLGGRSQVHYCYAGHAAALFTAECYLVVTPLDGTRKQTSIRMPHHKAVRAVAVDRVDSNVIAVALVDEVIIYDLVPVKQGRIQRIQVESVSCMSFSEKNREHIVMANAVGILVFSWASGTLILSRSVQGDALATPDSIYTSCAASHRFIYTLYKSNDLLVWNPTTDQTFDLQVEATSIALFGVVGDTSGCLHQIKETEGQFEVQCKVKRAHSGQIYCLTADEQGIVSVGEDNFIRTWTMEYEVGREISLDGHGAVDWITRKENKILFASSCGAISVLPSTSSSASSADTLVFGISELTIVDSCLLDEEALCIVGDDKCVHILDKHVIMRRKLRLSDYTDPLVCTGFKRILAVGMDDFTFFILDRSLEILTRTKADSIAVLKAGCLYFSCVSVPDEVVRLNVRGWDGYFEVCNFTKETFDPNQSTSSRPRPNTQRKLEYRLEQRKSDIHAGAKTENVGEELLLEKECKLQAFTGGLLVYSRQEDDAKAVCRTSDIVESFVTPASTARDLQAGSEVTKLDWVFGGGHRAALNAYGNLIYHVDSVAILDKLVQNQQQHLKHTSEITSMSIDRAGELVATTCLGSLNIWDANTCLSVCQMRGPFQQACFAPGLSTRLGALCQGGRLVVLECFENPSAWHNCASVIVPYDASSGTGDLHWAGDDALACGSWIYSVSQDAVFLVPNIKVTCASSVSFTRSPEVIYAIGTASGIIHYLDCYANFKNSVDAHKPEACSCLVSYVDGKSSELISGGMDGKILVWSSEIGSKAREITVHAPVSWISPYVFNGQTDLVVTTVTKDIVRVPVSTGAKSETLCFGFDACRAIAANPVFPSFVATISGDSTFRLWNVYAKKLAYIRRSNNGSSAEALSLSWHPSGEFLVMVEKQGITFFSFEMPKLASDLPMQSHITGGVEVLDAAIAPDVLGVLLSNATVVVYKIVATQPAEFKEAETITVNKGTVDSASRIDIGRCSATKRCILQVSHPQCVNFWYDCDTGQEVKEESTGQTCWSSYRSQHGWRMCGVRQKNIERVVTSPNLEHVAVLSGHGSLLHAYEFPVDPERRCTCAIDSCTRIVDMDFMSDNKHIVYATSGALYITRTSSR